MKTAIIIGASSGIGRIVLTANQVWTEFKERQVMNDRRRFFRIFFVLLAFAVLSFLRTLGRPSLANVRAVDIVQLIGTGMCLGAALVALVVGLSRNP